MGMVVYCLKDGNHEVPEAVQYVRFGRLTDRPFRQRGVETVKKGRHRRYEEARALKRNQDLDINEIFDSLDTDSTQTAEQGYSPAFDAWAEEFPTDEDAEVEDGESPDDAVLDPTSEEVDRAG